VNDVHYPLRENTIRTAHLNIPSKGGRFGAHVRGTKGHGGWDLNAPIGTTVYAVASGTVTHVLEGIRGYGTLIQLKVSVSGTYYYPLYAHLATVMVRKGNSVIGGQPIGLTGLSGNAKGEPPHLHFEVATSADLRKGRTNRVNPAVLLGNFLDNDDPWNRAVYDLNNKDSLDAAIERSGLYEKLETLSRTA